MPGNVVLAGVYASDLPTSFYNEVARIGTAACDIETSGLDWSKDSIGACQVYIPGYAAAVVRPVIADRPSNLIRVLENQHIRKIFHHAMFDLRFLVNTWKCDPCNISCTKIAAKILWPQSGQTHSLKALLRDILDIEISKDLQTSDWTTMSLSPKQLEYALSDVTYLPSLLDHLMEKLNDCGRGYLASKCFEHIPARVKLDLLGCGDVFAY